MWEDFMRGNWPAAAPATTGSLAAELAPAAAAADIMVPAPRSLATVGALAAADSASPQATVTARPRSKGFAVKFWSRRLVPVS
jgi:hypothetical protein